MGLRHQKHPEPREEVEPYDYARERELIEAGDLYGWEMHVRGRPAGYGFLDPMVHIADSVERINHVRRKRGEI